MNNGSITDLGDVTYFSGSSAQQISGSSLTIFNNITINNTVGVSLIANEKIKGTLSINAGTFSTNGYTFTFISDANGTARIAPIQGDISGNITMQRYLGPGANGWRFIASPVSGVTINDWQDNFITSGFPGSNYPTFPFVSVYSYSESVSGSSGNGFVAPASANDALTPGKGFMAYIGPLPVTIDVSGPPAKFAQTFSLSYTSSGGAANDGFVLLGNPYASTIDWSATGWTRNNVNNAVYIWNPVLQQYASWVAGTAVNGGSNLIASSQAFWVQANAGSPVLTCNESVKVATNATFLKAASSQNIQALNLKITGNNYSDETILLFNANAHKSFDADLDARKMYSSNPSVPAIATQDSSLNDLSINNLPNIGASLHIPVKVKVGLSGIYKIQRDSIYNLDPNSCVVLEDLLTGIRTNFATNDSYTFFIADTTQAPRFLLHVSGRGQTQSMQVSCAHLQNGKVIAKGEGAGPWSYNWYTNNNVLIKQTAFQFYADTLSQLAAGIYKVAINDQNGYCALFTSTIAVIEPPPVLAAFITNKDSLNAGIGEALVMTNLSQNAQNYIWRFGDGSANEISQQPQPHVYALNGVYLLRLVAGANTCKDSVFKKIIVYNQNTIGLPENQSISAAPFIYPNPGKGLFYLNMNTKDNCTGEIYVYDLSGLLVFKSKIEGGLNTIKMDSLVKGIYIYRIENGNSKLSGKLIVE